MKKITTIATCVILAMNLAACGSHQPSTNPSVTQSPTGSTPLHTHSYEVQQTKAPTCTAEGEMRYLCSCGDSYVENISVVEHTFTQWEETTRPTFSQVGEASRECETCGHTETMPLPERDIQEEIAAYAKLTTHLPEFTSADELVGGFLIHFVLFNVTPVSDQWNDETFQITRIYSLDDIDRCTNYYFGRTYDFLYLVEHNDDLSYDAEKNHLIWITYGAGGWDPCFMSEITQIDEDEYILSYYAQNMETEAISYYGQLTLKLVDDRLIITSHTIFR